MDVIKLLSEQGLVNGTYIAFIAGIFIYIPIVINKHFKALEKERNDFTTALKDITDKFITQLNKMDKNNELFFEKINMYNQKNADKLNLIHSDIKELINRK